jgi:formiminoglutamase
MKYFALGIHENYIPKDILKDVNENIDVDFITFEDIFLRQKRTWQQALKDAGEFIGGERYGIELDLDSIAHVPASAATPCGITSREALQYVAQMARHFEAAYIHICEGIASNDNALVGKLISYLVTTFVKAYHNKI